jgi:DNA-directed RNA polymerase subunit H (RpoH/RPB5)
MREPMSTVEKRASLLIKYRKLKVKKKEKEGDRTTYFLSRGDSNPIFLCVVGQRTIGISYVRELRDLIEETGADKGAIVTDGKYTYSAKANAPKMGIELIPRTLPSFDIFKHRLVSPTEILTEKERERIIKFYHAEPFQFPWIKASDPVSIILGAKPGDILKSSGYSETAGTYDSYRYVI